MTIVRDGPDHERRGMKINQLRALLAVADSGNINRAADALHLTQSAVSKSIRELEAELEVPLLVRNSQGAVLTSAGRMVAARARLINAEVARTRQEIATLKGELSGRLAIGVTPVTSTSEVADAIMAFQKRHPEVILTVVEERPGRLLGMVRDGTLDFAISTDIGGEVESCALVALATFRTVIGVRPGHPALRERRLADLLHYEWLTLDPLDDEWSPFVQCFRRAGLPLPQRVVQCSSIILYTTLARRGDAIGVWSETAFHHPRFIDLMTPLALDDTLPERTVYLLCRDLELMTRTARLLLDDVRRRMAG